MLQLLHASARRHRGARRVFLQLDATSGFGGDATVLARTLVQIGFRIRTDT